MSGRTPISLAVAVAAVIVLAVLASSGGAQSGERTIVLSQPAQWVPVLVDQRPRMGRGRGNAFSPGDQLISTHRLVDAAKRPAGRVELDCTTVSRSRSTYSTRFLCTGVAQLADGDLFLGARPAPPGGRQHGSRCAHGRHGRVRGRPRDIHLHGRAAYHLHVPHTPVACNPSVRIERRVPHARALRSLRHARRARRRRSRLSSDIARAVSRARLPAAPPRLPRAVALS